MKKEKSFLQYVLILTITLVVLSSMCAIPNNMLL